MRAHIWVFDKCENKNEKLLKNMVDDMSLQILNCIWESMKEWNISEQTLRRAIKMMKDDKATD